MAKSQRTTFAKLQRERDRQAKQAEKRERRRARAAGEELPSRDEEQPEEGNNGLPFNIGRYPDEIAKGGD